jgi:hypothetical protein
VGIKLVTSGFLTITRAQCAFIRAKAHSLCYNVAQVDMARFIDLSPPASSLLHHSPLQGGFLFAWFGSLTNGVRTSAGERYSTQFGGNPHWQETGSQQWRSQPGDTRGDLEEWKGSKQRAGTGAAAGMRKDVDTQAGCKEIFLHCTHIIFG